MKVKLKVRHTAGIDPGIWKESTLVFRVRGDREDVKNLEASIREALGDTARLSNYEKYNRAVQDSPIGMEGGS